MATEERKSTTDTVTEARFVQDFLLTALRPKIQDKKQWGVTYKVADGEEYVDRDFDRDNVMEFTTQLSATIAALPVDEKNAENIQALKLLARNKNELHGAVALMTQVIRQSDNYFQHQTKNVLFVAPSAESTSFTFSSPLCGKEATLHCLPTDADLVKSLLETHRGFEAFHQKAVDKTVQAVMENIRTPEGVERPLEVNPFLNVGRYGSNINGQMARATDDPNFADYYRTYSHIQKVVDATVDGIEFYKDGIDRSTTAAISQRVEVQLMGKAEYTQDEMRIAIALKDIQHLERPGHRSIDIEALSKKVEDIFQVMGGEGDSSGAVLSDMEGDEVLAQLVAPLREMKQAAGKMPASKR